MKGCVMGDTVVVHRDAYAYISHPSIALLENGEWLAAFNHSRRRDPQMHPPSDPLFRTLLARSSDNGATWQPPVFAPDFDWSGTECPGIAQLSDGTVVLTQFRFGWYPLGLAKQRRAAGEPISICLPEQNWTEDFVEADWACSRYSWARGYHGVYAHLSPDTGETFNQTVKIGMGPYRDGYSRTGVVELSDGRVAYALTEHHPPSNRYTFLVCSDDGGKTWESPELICDDPDRIFGEPDIAEIAPGELYCVLRCGAREFLHGCRSSDGGTTWSTPKPTTMDGHPGHLLNLIDGRMLCTYGRRKAPFGIRAAISEDGGRTWLSGEEIVIRDDLPNGDLGYPTTIEYGNGELFCIYYGQDGDGITHVTGTYLSLE